MFPIRSSKRIWGVVWSIHLRNSKFLFQIPTGHLDCIHRLQIQSEHIFLYRSAYQFDDQLCNIDGTVMVLPNFTDNICLSHIYILFLIGFNNLIHCCIQACMSIKVRYDIFYREARIYLKNSLKNFLLDTKVSQCIYG